jgi:hypothetical protein
MKQIITIGILTATSGLLVFYDNIKNSQAENAKPDSSYQICGMTYYGSNESALKVKQHLKSTGVCQK